MQRAEDVPKLKFGAVQRLVRANGSLARRCSRRLQISHKLAHRSLTHAFGKRRMIIRCEHAGPQSAVSQAAPPARPRGER
eukprot:6195243-Pleurochrysis_carterae.AAC.1